MKGNIPPIVLRIADRLRRVYWKIARPKTYGVKGLIIHPDDSNKVILIRNSYGQMRRYTLPGGGYRPKQEMPRTALRREVLEELGLDIGKDIYVLDELVTTREGKRDNLVLLRAIARSTDLRLSNEVAEALWVDINLTTLPHGASLSVFAQKAIEIYRRHNSAKS